MDIRQIRSALLRASSLLSAAGASKQAVSVDAVDALIKDAGDLSIEDFVARSKAALLPSQMPTLAADDIARQFLAAGSDKAAFETLLAQLADKAVDKMKVFQVTSIYTGASETAWKSKPKALDAIRAAFDQRAYLEAKRQINEKVTPW